MKRVLNLALTLALLLILVPGAGVSAAPQEGGEEQVYATGLIWDSWEVIEANLREGPVIESELPPSVNQKDVFPAPGNQGRQESCVPWALSYALRSHQEEVKRNWGLHTDGHLFSPGYVYNQINYGVNKGSNIGLALSLLVEQGACTLASFPYDESDYLTQPTTAQRAEAAYFRAREWYTISGRDSIKRRLAEGDGVVVGIEIFPDLDYISPDNPVFDVVNGTSRGGHAVCLIGYDDEKGAFEFINSWGTGWGLDGYGWISYDLLEDTRVNKHGVSVGYVLETHDDIVIENFFDATVQNGEATIVKYLGSGGNVVIPDSLGGYPVTAIGDRVFQNNTSITGVTIPDSVTTIGYAAFSSCIALDSAVIGNGVTAIGIEAFRDCKSLTGVVIGNSVTTIGYGAFSGCTLLAGFAVNEDNPNYEGIEGVLFDKSLKTLVLYPAGKADVYTIPNNVTTIGAGSFTHCTSLTGVIIPDSVTVIDDSAFFKCTALAKVVIPDSVTSIGSYAFEGCRSLADAAIGTGLTSIGNFAFKDCMSLTDVVLYDSVISIGNFAFMDCMSLTNAVIPDSVTSIGGWAFHYSTPLERRYPLPNLTIQCYENTYAHDYAIEKGFPFSIIKAETKILEVSPLPNTGSITVNHIAVTKTSNGFYNLAVDFSKAGEVFFFLAVYEGDLLKKTYIADVNTEIKGIAKSDLSKGIIYIWDKNMQPCIEAIKM